MAYVRNLFVILIFATSFLSTKGQCDDFEYRDDYSPEVAPICFMLYEKFEESLVDEHLNLYKLRHVFFPNANAEPIVVVITYNITIHGIGIERCTGININKNNTMLQNETHFTVRTNITWTSSLAFSVLHPQVIDQLLPTSIYLLGPIRGSYFNFGDSSADLLLHLNIFLSCNPLRSQVTGALKDLTTKVSSVKLAGLHFTHCSTFTVRDTQIVYARSQFQAET